MGSVWKYTPEGELILLLGNFHAHNVSLDSHSNVITAHGENSHTMVRLNNVGSIDTLHHSLDYREFSGGNCTYAPNGEIVFGIENKLWRINDVGVKEAVSDYRFQWNQTVYVDADGNYYGPDIGIGNGSLVKIDSEGNAETLATGLIDKHPFDPHSDVLLGITKDAAGNLYIADTGGKRIARINEDKEVETFYTSDGLWFPTGVDFVGTTAYILENKSDNGLKGPRIIKLDGAGNKSIVFNYETYKAEGENPSKQEGRENENDNDSGLWLYLISGGLLFVLLWLWRRIVRFKKLSSLSRD
ncbi:MAG: hypothetical protein Aureis2KO_08860 [Aureisphaera sp.]